MSVAMAHGIEAFAYRFQRAEKARCIIIQICDDRTIVPTSIRTTADERGYYAAIVEAIVTYFLRRFCAAGDNSVNARPKN